MRPTSEVLHVLGPFLFFIVLALVAMVVYVWRKQKLSTKVGNVVPLKYIAYEDQYIIYQRSDRRLYQRVGDDLQIEVCRLRDGSVHMLGKPTALDPNELVKIVDIRGPSG